MDEIIISIGINDTKRTYFSLEKRLKAIQELYKDEPRVRVMSYDSLTVISPNRPECRVYPARYSYGERFRI